MPIADLIASYDYVIIMGFESAGVPLPGETILISMAVYAGSTSSLNIAIVVTGAAATAILSDNLRYWVDRPWGLPILMRYGHLTALDHGRLKFGQYIFREHGGKISSFGRFTAMLRAYAAVLAGVSRPDARRFMLFHGLGGSHEPALWALAHISGDG